MILALFFSLNTAFAHNDCAADLSEVNRQAVSAINAFLPFLTYLTVPEWPHIVNDVSEDQPAVFFPRLNRVFISHPYFMKHGRGNGELAYQVALQHELGHAIFNANMADYDDDWAKVFKRNSKPLPKTRFGYWLRKKTGREYPELVYLSIPYQELFADLLPVIAGHNPDLMEFALQVIGGTHAERRARSFRGSFLGRQTPATEAHQIFAPVRAYLWSSHISKFESDDHAAQFLAKVFHVLALEIVDRGNDETLWNITPLEMNMRLMARLATELQ